MNNWSVDYLTEIEHALLARSQGNEGMARVCARRAAGIVIGEYLHQRGLADIHYSAYECLSRFLDLPDIDNAYKQVVGHFIMKVNPEHNLPGDADLISEAIWLKTHLLEGKNG